MPSSGRCSRSRWSAGMRHEGAELLSSRLPSIAWLSSAVHQIRLANLPESCRAAESWKGSVASPRAGLTAAFSPVGASAAGDPFFGADRH